MYVFCLLFIIYFKNVGYAFDKRALRDTIDSKVNRLTEIIMFKLLLYMTISLFSGFMYSMERFGYSLVLMKHNQQFYYNPKFPPSAPPAEHPYGNYNTCGEGLPYVNQLLHQPSSPKPSSPSADPMEKDWSQSQTDIQADNSTSISNGSQVTTEVAPDKKHTKSSNKQIMAGTITSIVSLGLLALIWYHCTQDDQLPIDQQR
jgi:hypothetical protein